MSEKVRALNSSSVDVLHVNFDGQTYLFAHTTHRVKDLLKKIEIQFRTNQNITQFERERLLSEGVDCQLLERNTPDWKKGKLRIRLQLEFVPEEVSEEDSIEFPLDEIRQTLNGGSSIDG